MELGGPMPHSQGLSNNPYPEPYPRIETYFFKVHSNIILPSTPRLPNDLFPVGLPAKILKELLHSSILAICPAHPNLIDLITLSLLG